MLAALPFDVRKARAFSGMRVNYLAPMPPSIRAEPN